MFKKYLTLVMIFASTFAFAKGDLKQAAKANNEFGWKLFRQVVADEAKAKKDTNILISSLSASVALSMAQAGATGDTQKEIIKALGFSGSGDDLNEATNLLARELLDRKSEEKVKLANLVLGNSENFKISGSYEKTIGKCLSVRKAMRKKWAADKRIRSATKRVVSLSIFWFQSKAKMLTTWVPISKRKPTKPQWPS